MTSDNATLSQDLKLTLDFRAIFASLPDAVRADLIREASMQSWFVMRTVQMLADGSTDDDCWFDSVTMNEMSLLLTDRMDDVAQRTIRTLLAQNASLKAELERKDAWAWSMYHAWGNKVRPELAAWTPTPMVSDEQVAALLANARGAA